MIALPPKRIRKRVELDITHDCLVALSRIRGVRAARNNNGVIEDRRGIPITFGLGEGSPDLVGLITFGGANTCEPRGISAAGLALLRTLEPVAVAFGIEVKQPKRYATKSQKTWHAAGSRRGIRCSVARCDLDAVLFVSSLIDSTAMMLRRISGGLA